METPLIRVPVGERGAEREGSIRDRRNAASDGLRIAVAILHDLVRKAVTL
jgi:hypothetical protein